MDGDTVIQVQATYHRILSGDWNVWAPPEAIRIHIPLVDPEGLSTDGMRVRGTATVADAEGRTVGSLEFRWISEMYRRAVIEMDTEAGVSPPLNNGAGQSWREVFAPIGWDLEIATGGLNVPTPPDGKWNFAELHDAMLKSRDRNDLDVEWRYHIAAVRHFRDPGGFIGVAYDHESTDFNKVPREGVAIQAHAILPRHPAYGANAGRRLMDCPDWYFFTAVHEIGHAMGLYHNHLMPGAMRTLADVVHGLDGAGRSGPVGADFSFDDLVRLRFLPDIYVRPGGSEWEIAGVVEDRNSAEDRSGHHHHGVHREAPQREGPFEFELGMVDTEVPMGAPVRLNMALWPKFPTDRKVPGRYGLSTPYIQGWVDGPRGTQNSFRSIFKPTISDTPANLVPGEVRVEGVTLLRGRNGALFDTSGMHTIWVVVEWWEGEHRISMTRKTRVRVAPTGGAAHARARQELSRTPEALWYMAIGRNPSVTRGEEAVLRALEAPELYRHFGYIHARAQSVPFRDRPVNTKRVLELIEDQEVRAVLNRMESAKADTIQKNFRSKLAQKV